MYGEHNVKFIKVAANRNLIKLATAYDTNCSSQEYAEVNDETLEFILNSELKFSSAGRNERNHTVPYPEEDKLTVKIGAITDSVEEIYFSERNQEEIDMIQKILSILTPCQRKRMYMYFKLNLTYKEIGEKEGVGFTAIQHSCEIALKKLKPYGEILRNTTIVKWLDLLI